jgi:hypothetical protein
VVQPLSSEVTATTSSRRPASRRHVRCVNLFHAHRIAAAELVTKAVGDFVAIPFSAARRAPRLVVIQGSIHLPGTARRRQRRRGNSCGHRRTILVDVQPWLTGNMCSGTVVICSFPWRVAPQGAVLGPEIRCHTLRLQRFGVGVSCTKSRIPHDVPSRAHDCADHAGKR